MAPLVGLSAYWWDWADLLLRLLHVIAAIAWIGASFYFVALDNHLRPPADERDAARGVGGEAWEIHGGGFYRVEKFRVAPETLPEPLHWFKWEAYTTWLSGFGLLVVVYFVDARAYLVDPAVADLETWHAIAIAVGALAVAWLVYDGLCRLLTRREGVLAAAVVALVAGSAWAMGELLAARAAFLEVGAMLGTIMAANVFFVIIPAHRELVRAKEEGREPDPHWNVIGKQRSVHNNYLTLPVLLAMLAGHAPFLYGHDRAWLLFVGLAALGAFTRHFFNLRHRGRNAWWIPAVAAVVLVAIAIGARPEPREPVGRVPTFAEVRAVLDARCTPCHAARPTQPGFASGPAGGIALETRRQVEANATRIIAQIVDSRAMPPGNVTGMTGDERDLLARWLASR